jgi:hypothetical protein
MRYSDPPCGRGRDHMMSRPTPGDGAPEQPLGTGMESNVPTLIALWRGLQHSAARSLRADAKQPPWSVSRRLMPAREPRSSARLWKLVESVVLPLAIIALASGLRLWNLGQPDPKSYDEGVRLEQLYLMAAGFRPFHDISADQGPLLLEYFFPFFNSLGRDATAARAAVVVASLVCLVATYLSARRLGGPMAGLGALAFLGLKTVSRTVAPPQAPLAWLTLRTSADCTHCR